MTKIREYKILIIVSLAILFGLFAFLYFHRQPALTGTSPSNVWTAKHTKNDTYWDGILERDKDQKITLTKFVVVENGEATDYTPPTALKSDSTFDFMGLGERPKRNDTFIIQVEWTDNKGNHKEEFPLKRSYNPL